MSRDGQTARCLHDSGELQLHTGKRKPQHAIVAAVIPTLLIVLLQLDGVAAGREGCDSDGAGKIGAEHCQQKEFSLGLHARLFGQVGAQVSFGQQV